MTDDKDITSIKVAAGKRTYFLDVKQTREGATYLKLSESKRLDNGEYERHRVMIFEDDINKIVEALRTVLPHFKTYKKPETKSKMDETKEKFSNAYKPWTEEDDLKLIEHFCEGKKPKELSEIFQRNIGAINSRIKKLELIEKYGR
jgi:hypothetical protein